MHTHNGESSRNELPFHPIAWKQPLYILLYGRLYTLFNSLKCWCWCDASAQCEGSLCAFGHFVTSPKNYICASTPKSLNNDPHISSRCRRVKPVWIVIVSWRRPSYLIDVTRNAGNSFNRARRTKRSEQFICIQFSTNDACRPIS